MDEPRQYLVQPCLDSETLAFGPGQITEAGDPHDAALKVFGGQISFIGTPDDMLGRVMRLAEAERTEVSLVYRARSAAPA